MAHNNGKITAPVDFLADVAYVLGSNSGDAATLCTHPGINKWAKFKPERNATKGVLSLQQRKSNNFGLSPAATYNSISSFVTVVRNGTFKPGWNYLGPVDGWPYRITDFDGYNDNAEPPFGGLSTQAKTLSADSTVPTEIAADSPVDDSGALNLADFEGGQYTLRNWYFGILLCNSSRYFIATVDKPFHSVQDWQVSFGWINPAHAGTYTGVPFIANQRITNGGNEPSPLTIMGIESTGVSIILQSITDVYVPLAYCQYTASTGTKVNYTAIITNEDSSAHTFTNVALLVAKNEDGKDQTTLVNFGSVTVPAKSTWERTGTANVQSRDYQFCQLYYIGGDNHSQWVNFDEEETDPDAPPA